MPHLANRPANATTTPRRHFQTLRFLLKKSNVQKYVGWSLADAEFGDIAPGKARIVFYIMVAGWKELPGLDAILRSLYHVDHLFLLHMDVKVRSPVHNSGIVLAFVPHLV